MQRAREDARSNEVDLDMEDPHDSASSRCAMCDSVSVCPESLCACVCAECALCVCVLFECVRKCVCALLA